MPNQATQPPQQKTRRVAVMLGANLARQREAAGLSQAALAGLSGIESGSIAEYEAGRREPRLPTFLKLANALDLTAEELLDGIVWEPGEVNRGKFVVTPHDEGKEDVA